jgi:hypothetical protein
VARRHNIIGSESLGRPDFDPRRAGPRSRRRRWSVRLSVALLAFAAALFLLAMPLLRAHLI